MGDDARNDDGRDAGSRNEAVGGRNNNYVQAASITGDIHLHQDRGDERGDIENPIIASVDLKPGSTNAVLVVDDEPPRVVAPSGTVHVVTLEARTWRAVVLHSARLVVVSRRFPRPACLTARIAGMLEPRRFTADFDADPPELRAAGPGFPFTISATDVEQFRFEPVAHSEEIRWRLEFDWTCAGHRGTAVVDHNGQPFETYPIAALFTDDGGPSVLHSGCGSNQHEAGCPVVRLESLSPGATRKAYGPVVPC